MLDHHGAHIGPSPHDEEFRSLRLNLHLLAIFQSDGQAKRLIPSVRIEIDAGNRLHIHIAAKAVLAIFQADIVPARFNEARELRIFDEQLLPIDKTDDDSRGRRGRLQP